jgi:ADP-heptose:LPS heptosyltransferase/predicted SAM-dependent methyltransferase
MVWRIEDPQGDESSKIKYEIVPYTRGRVLDIGCGNHKPFAHFIGVDNNKDAHLFGILCKPDLCMDAENLELVADGSMDAVYSAHTLEHVEDPLKVLKHWWSKIKVYGYLILYLPHKGLYPNIGEKGANPDHKHDFVPSVIVNHMRKVGQWDMLRDEVRGEGREYSFFQVYQKLPKGHQQKFSWSKPRPPKKAAVIRYGAYGDLLQASSIFKGLKDDGYHVTLHSSPPGVDVVSADPNIDEIIIQDKDQVPNLELGLFWDSLRPKYDKFVNLSESCEGSLLALPGRTPYGWSPAARHALCNLNYLEVQHALAGVPHKPQVMFYPTEEEKKWAKVQRQKMGRYVILWALAGSGVHKTWPYVDAVIANLMLSYPDVDVILTGDQFCQMLEGGWDKEPRVHRMSARISMRQALSLAQISDCVIGPETGMLNSVSCMDMPKIVFLSHSTHENLTRDWKNVYPMWAANVECIGRGKNEAPACHSLIYGWQHCTKAEGEAAGTAMCQSLITPEAVCQVLHKVIDESNPRIVLAA